MEQDVVITFLGFDSLKLCYFRLFVVKSVHHDVVGILVTSGSRRNIVAGIAQAVR